RIDQANERRIANIVERENLVELPPQSLQDFGEVFGRVARQGYSAGESAVKMRMRADIAWHHILPARVKLRGARISCPQFGRRAEINDPIAFDIKGVVLKNPIDRDPGKERGVSDQHS